MSAEPSCRLRDIVNEVGRYSEEAYHFVREGLNCAVEHVHGPPSPAVLKVSQYVAEERIDLAELLERFEEGRLEPEVAAAVQAAGGCEKLNRHVSGQELCWAMRDLALDRWGLLAATVLRTWNITNTLDFGRIVFAMIQHDLMQKQPDDHLEDFDAVYDFDQAMTRAYRVGDESQELTSHQ